MGGGDAGWGVSGEAGALRDGHKCDRRKGSRERRMERRAARGANRSEQGTPVRGGSPQSQEPQSQVMQATQVVQAAQTTQVTMTLQEAQKLWESSNAALTSPQKPQQYVPWYPQPPPPTYPAPQGYPMQQPPPPPAYGEGGGYGYPYGQGYGYYGPPQSGPWGWPGYGYQQPPQQMQQYNVQPQQQAYQYGPQPQQQQPRAIPRCFKCGSPEHIAPQCKRVE
jgi:hypothetical protein